MPKPFKQGANMNKIILTALSAVFLTACAMSAEQQKKNRMAGAPTKRKTPARHQRPHSPTAGTHIV